MNNRKYTREEEKKFAKMMGFFSTQDELRSNIFYGEQTQNVSSSIFGIIIGMISGSTKNLKRRYTDDHIIRITDKYYSEIKSNSIRIYTEEEMLEYLNYQKEMNRKVEDWTNDSTVLWNKFDRAKCYYFTMQRVNFEK